MTYLVFFHIIAVLWFIGGVVATNVLMIRASRSKDTAFIRITVDYAGFFETFFTLPGTIIAGATGVILAWRQGYGLLGTGWVLASWAVFAGAFVVAVGYMLPDLYRTRRLAGDAAAKGEMTAELTKALANPGPPLVGQVLIVALIALVVFMVFKPF